MDNQNTELNNADSTKLPLHKRVRVLFDKSSGFFFKYLKDIESMKTIELPYQKSYAVVIGINKYQDTKLNLQNSVRDAKVIKKVLQDQGFEVKFLQDKKATKQNIEDLIVDTFKHTSKDDRVLVFFSGHGDIHRKQITSNNAEAEEMKSGFIIPYDAEKQMGGDWNPSLVINMGSFEHLFKNIQANHRLLILNCCLSGKSVTTVEPTEDLNQDMSRLLKKNLMLPAMKVIAASTHNENAANDTIIPFTGEKAGISAFTYALVEALSGKADINNDGVLTHIEIFKYVHNKVKEQTKYFRTKDNKKFEQTPSLGTFEGDSPKSYFVFVPNGYTIPIKFYDSLQFYGRILKNSLPKILRTSVLLTLLIGIVYAGLAFNQRAYSYTNSLISTVSSNGIGISKTARNQKAILNKESTILTVEPNLSEIETKLDSVENKLQKIQSSLGKAKKVMVLSKEAKAFKDRYALVQLDDSIPLGKELLLLQDSNQFSNLKKVWIGDKEAWIESKWVAPIIEDDEINKIYQIIKNRKESKIDLKAGVYRFNKSLHFIGFTDTISITGEGFIGDTNLAPRTILLFNTGSYAMKFQGDDKPKAETEFILENLHIEHITNSENQSSNVIFVENSNIEFNNIVVAGAKHNDKLEENGSGITFREKSTGTVANSYFINNQGFGISHYDTSDVNVIDSFFYLNGNQTQDSGGVSYRNMSKGELAVNQFGSIDDDGCIPIPFLRGIPSYDNCNNDQGNNGNGVYVAETASPKITHNIFQDNAHWGIYVEGCARADITNVNQIRFNKMGGIYIGNSETPCLPGAEHYLKIIDNRFLEMANTPSIKIVNEKLIGEISRNQCTQDTKAFKITSEWEPYVTDNINCQVSIN